MRKWLFILLSLSLSCSRKAAPAAEVLFSFEGVPGIEERYDIQGCAVWDSLAFCLFDGGSCRVVDLGSMTLLADFPLGSADASNHANVAFFGPCRYEPSDPFPLLYVSRASGDRALFVERILTDCEGFPSGAETVQRIWFDSARRHSRLWIAAKDDVRCLYCYGNTVGNRQKGNRVLVYKFAFPEFHPETAEIHLTEEDVLDSLFFDEMLPEGAWGPQNSILQGAMVRGGVLYLPIGTGHKYPSEFFFASLEGRGQACRFDFGEDLPLELEDADVSGDRLIFTANGNGNSLSYICSLPLNTFEKALKSVRRAPESEPVPLHFLAGNYKGYPSPEPHSLKAPEGYTPVYISHFGRHGSRFHADSLAYSEIIELFTNQKSKNNLTAAGKAFLKDLRRLSRASQGRMAMLTDKGRSEVAGIAARLREDMPELFAGDACIEARSTVVPRAVQTMRIFCDELSSQNQGLTISMVSDTLSEIPLLGWTVKNPYYTAADDVYIHSYSRSSWNSGYRERLSGGLDSLAFLGRFFRDPSGVRTGMDAPAFLRKMYFIACTDMCRDEDSDMLSYFGIEELNGIWKALNYRYYHIFGPSVEDAGRHYSLMYTILEDMLERADSDLASGECQGRLRFGHDTQVDNLLTLIGERRWCSRAAEKNNIDKYFDWGFAPMAANIQLRFYRNCAGDILVRALIDENDMDLPVNRVDGCFYPWPELRRYLFGRLEGAVGLLTQTMDNN